ncbi:MAG: hypothetical protein K2J62_03945 [Bacteroidales bacterium]|nr:hypothetical protein [Bacteroidales bacterium]
MRIFAYILPVAAAVYLIAATGNWDIWYWYLAGVAAIELVLFLCQRGIFKVKEYLSGFAVSAEHHFPWTEKVTRTETYTDSKGKTHTRTTLKYVYHPDEWYWSLNTGKAFAICEEEFQNCRDSWRTEPIEIFPYHANCVSGGGGVAYQWDKDRRTAYTVTYTGKYKNYVRNSHSIFRTDEIDRKTARELGLIDYPVINGWEQDVIASSSKLGTDIMHGPMNQREFHLLNAFNGMKNQIHIFALLFPASSGIGIAEKQRAYWQGGNKNEFTICLGVEREDGKGIVRWCKCFSWCDEPYLEAATEDYFLTHTVLNWTMFSRWLQGNIHLWRRKEFSDFKYLGLKGSVKQNLSFYAISIILCVIGAFIAIRCNL